jgi:hypothetical protein
LIAGQPPARFGCRADACIHEQTATANFDENAAGAYFIGAAKKGDLHGSIVA